MSSMDKCLPPEAASIASLSSRYLDMLAAVALEEPRARPLVDKHYVVLEAVGLKFSLEEARTLVDLGLMQEKIVDRVLRCPRCDYLNLRPKLLCPHCDSTNIERVRIIQHVICGYIDLEFMFKQDGRMVCPNCSLEITSENDYRVLGTLFYCHNCHMRFHEPNVMLLCERCGTRFRPSDGSYKPVSTLTLTDTGKRIVENAIDLRIAIYRAFNEHSVRVECGKTLEGATGVSYNVDYYLPEKRVAVDIVPSLTVHSEALLLLVKTRDLVRAGKIKLHVIVTRRASPDSVKSISEYESAVLVNEPLPSHASKKVLELVLSGEERDKKG